MLTDEEKYIQLETLGTAWINQGNTQMIQNLEAGDEEQLADKVNQS